MADSYDLSGIHEELLDYARDNRDHIFTGIYTPGVTEADERNGIYSMDDYTNEMDTPDEIVFTEIYANAALKPGGRRDANGKIFRPKVDALGINTRKGKVREIQQDFIFTREKIYQLKKSYFAQCKRMKINPDELPFSQYIMAELEKMAAAELRIAHFKAVYNSNANAQSFLDMYDGILKQIADDIVSGDIPEDNIVEQAALSATNGVASMEAIVAAIPTEMLSSMVCIVSRKAKKFYEDDYRTRYGLLPWNNGVQKAFIDGTSIEFRVEPGMDGYNKPIFMPVNNITRLYDSTEKSGLEIDYDKRERDIAIVMDGQAGIGYGVSRRIYTMVEA